MPPKVFLSHAGEDKERFVVEFAKRLREKGIDAWFDKWEILPGDSLVDKIFEEGLKDADAIIVVLSENSINKPWVREELNASMIKRISKGTKIIPVVLEECEIPESLRSTLWERIKDLNNYQENLDRIIAAIFGHREKPPIGQTPKYTSFDITDISGLTRGDNLVLKMSCESELQDYNYIVNPKNVFIKDSEFIVPESELRESLEILDQNGYIELHGTLGSDLDSYSILPYGFEKYARTYIPDYQETLQNVIIMIVNQGMRENIKIAETLNKPLYLIDHIYKLLETKGHVKLSNELGRSNTIFEVSASLKRLLM
jgi:hypothetical protein